MTFRENQDEWIRTFAEAGNWPDRFNLLIELGEGLPAECPAFPEAYRLEGCQSKTYFMVEKYRDQYRVSGWSNAAVTRGIIAVMTHLYDGLAEEELAACQTDWHLKTGLYEHLTPQRRAALATMLGRVQAL